MTPPFVHDVNDYFTYAKATLQEISQTKKVSDMLVVMRGSNLPADLEVASSCLGGNTEPLFALDICPAQRQCHGRR